MSSKHYYTITKGSELLAVPASTLRLWERAFSMFNPNRTAGGQRRFMVADVKMAKRIRELLNIKGLSTDAAIEMMNKTYRKSRPHGLLKCQTPKNAIALLEEDKAVLEDAHAVAKIKAVSKYQKSLGDVEK